MQACRGGYWQRAVGIPWSQTSAQTVWLDLPPVWVVSGKLAIAPWIFPASFSFKCFGVTGEYFRNSALEVSPQGDFI